ncbi:transcriptional regulator [Streptomyces sp. DH24]|uniref:helix-turn-helix transcriptional regulator n=1 Tax=Streptomyces sp. DH24 TaxID=3040123 RepID=UPI002440F035|nr:PAS domain-containing protein [Streptomyces sp. DH24]MDG9717284.1 PAS domain-containing protein [Streptomyces sp. DH24]
MNVERAVDGERDAILAALRPVVDGLAATFGPVCEVVLHDYRRPEQSVVAVAGSVTGRAVGGAMSEIGMRVLAHGDDAGDDLNYLTRTQDGTPVKSSTMVLRDSTGTVFGALCVNLDVGAVTRAHDLLGALAGVAAAPAELPVTTFGDDIDAVVDAIVDTHRSRQDGSWAELDRDRRLELFRALDARGVFAVRRAVEHVATRLGISRASAYSYLARARTAGQDEETDRRTTGTADRKTVRGTPKASDTTTAGGHA